MLLDKDKIVPSMFFKEVKVMWHMHPTIINAAVCEFHRLNDPSEMSFSEVLKTLTAVAEPTKNTIALTMDEKVDYNSMIVSF